MGSQSDWPNLVVGTQILRDLEIDFAVQIVSAHRTPERLREYALNAQANGLRAIIACAGGAAHLPGMLAAWTIVPVLGVPAPSAYLNGLDSLLSIVQMPKGVPVASFAIGEAGGANAALFAASLLAQQDPAIAQRLTAWREAQTASVAETPEGALAGAEPGGDSS